MVRTYLADLHQLEDSEIYEKYYQTLPLWRKEKIDKIKPLKNKIQSLGAWSLFTAAANSTSPDIKKITVSQENFLSTCYVNISHSGYYGLCTISDKSKAKVGCDIETLGKFRESVARRYFCVSEYQQLLHAQDRAERTYLFYRYWVLKESFLKATRQGMKLDTRSFEIGWKKKSPNCQQPYLLKQPENFPGSYYYQEYTLAKALIPAAIAICTTDPEIDPTLHILNF